MARTWENTQTMTKAYRQICARECDPWIAIGNFRNAWYGYAKDKREALVRDPIPVPENPTKYVYNWGAFCAASVEFLCERYNVPCPEWVHHPRYILPEPWYAQETPGYLSESVKRHRAETAPAPYAKRNLFCGNRLFLNKYESSAWAVEAREKGLSGIEVGLYVRERERAIHG